MRGDVVLEMPTDLRATPKPTEFEFGPEHAQRPRGITRLTVDIPSTRGGPSPSAKPRPPPRWRTPEFMLYAVMFAVVVPIMIWIPVRLSSASHPNFRVYQRRLSPGWLFGRHVDDSDAQYHSFRSNLPILSGLALVFLALRTVYTKSRRIVASSDDTRLYMIPFLIVFSGIMVTVLHGTSVLKILVIITVNYAIAKLFRDSRLNPLLTWIFNGLALFANETFHGYQFSALHSSLGYLDNLEGIYPRWHIIFNITMLRLVSFNLDYYWACKGSTPPEANVPSTHKQRTTIAHPVDLYSFGNYLAYLWYPPLYIGGPIMTFNDFTWQLRKPLRVSGRDVLGYLIRFLSSVLVMEFILHFMYVVAIKDANAWHGDTAAELSMIGFWNLMIMWLKLLIPWRFFRLWALADGIDPPENMVRCVANNYSALGFWRSWHRSYNLWLIRYIHIPLGGAKNVVFSTLTIFTFVALWHDLSFRLLAWGWLVSLFILPELIASYLLPANRYGDAPWYRHICALGAVFNILMMMAANLVGFVIGTEGVSYLLSQLLSGWQGIQFMFFACACLFVGVQVMFEYREEEMRKGIYRRC